MVNTIIYVQEHGYNTQTELKNAFSNSQRQLDLATDQLLKMNSDLKSINRQIHYTGQYFAQKAVYTEFLKAKNKGRFRKEHISEIQAYEEARDWLKSFYPDGKMHSIKSLKEQKVRLQDQINQQKASIRSLKDLTQDLRTVDKNVEAILRNQVPKKTKDTGDRIDRLSAFKIAASLQGCTPKAALAGMMSKHVVSLYDMCYSSLLQFDLEQWDEKITDCINYLILLKALIKEEQAYGSH